MHTLVAVHTDEGLVGLGSVFTNDELVQGALDVLEPLYRGETRARARAREREAAPAHLLARPRRRDHAHHQRHRHRAVGHCSGKATGQPVGRLLGGRYRERVRPYASLLMEEPGPTARSTAGTLQGAGLPRVQDRLGAVRPA